MIIINFAIMFKYLFFVFSLALLNMPRAYSQTEGELNKTDERGLKQGVWKAYHKNGKLRYSGQFKDDKPVGKFNYYFLSGELQSILEHGNTNEVNAIHYYENGEKMAEGKYKDKKKFGNWISYGAGNSKVNEGNYIMGKKNGEWKTYYPNGQTSEITNYSDDIENGAYKTYYENGSLLQETQFIKGSMEGMGKFYFPNGEVKMQGQYKRGTKDGVWKYYTEEGKLKREIEYDAGRRITPLFEDELPDYNDSLKTHVKDELEFEDMEGKIKYEKGRK